MTVKKGQILELSVIDIAFGGKGLAKLDGLAIFVDPAVPRDRVRARIVKKKKNYAEARVIEILEASPYRRTPPCPYSGHCGGCKWQFLDYDRQLEYKRRHVADALRHIALMEGVQVHPVIPSALEYGYRNKMEFSCSDRRWLLPEEMGREDIDTGFALGLHVPGTFHKVLDTRACLLQPSLGNRILGDVRRFMQSSGVPVYGLKSHVGFWRYLMLRHSVSRDQWMVNIVTASEKPGCVEPLAALLTNKYPQIISVVNNVNARKAGIAVGEVEIPLAGQSYLTDAIGAFEFDISANSFFQTNTRGAERLYEIVRDLADPAGDESVLDLYSGTGTISIWLSEAVKTVVGLEISGTAVSDARNNCRRNHVDNCHFIRGDIRKSLAQIPKTPDLMIIDPPRSGMHKDVVKQMLAMAPPKIVYVSCNPPTMARDLLMMKDQYRVVDVHPVDMFPHTYHIEAVALLAPV